MAKKQQNRRGKNAPIAKVDGQPEPRAEIQKPVEQARPESDAPDATPAAAQESREHDRNPSGKGAGSATTPAVRPETRHPVRPDAVQATNADIRGVLIQLAGARLLLPNATIAEVLSYAPPEPVEAAPAWLLGKIRWRGWQLPLVAFAELAGIGREPAGLGSKVVVLKALAGNAKAPYFAILSQGFPRLVTVSQAGLVSDTDSSQLPLGVHSRVIMNEDTAFVPDLGAVESLITDALAQVA